MKANERLRWFTMFISFTSQIVNHCHMCLFTPISMSLILVAVVLRDLTGNIYHTNISYVDT